MKPPREQKGAHFEGLSLRLVSRLVDLPGPRQLISGTVRKRVGFSLLDALELPADVAPYTHQHLIMPPPAKLPAGNEEGHDG